MATVEVEVQNEDKSDKRTLFRFRRLFDMFLFFSILLLFINYFTVQRELEEIRKNKKGERVDEGDNWKIGQVGDKIPIIGQTVHEGDKRESDLKSSSSSNSTDPVVLITAGGNLNTSEIYDPKTGKSCSLPELQDRTRYHSQNGKYKCGGASGYARNDETRNTCVQWNPQSGTWTKSHDLIQPRQIHVTWVTASGVYLMGGWWSPTTTEIINDGGQVREGFSLRYRTRAACAISGNEEVIITGGYEEPTKVSVYSEEGWQQDLPSFNEERRHHACSSFVHNGKKVLMVTAGVSGDGRGVTDVFRDSTEIFIDNVWKTIAGKLPSRTNACVAINIDNRILLFGGTHGKTGGADDRILEYNQVVEEWQEIGSMNEARWGQGMSVVAFEDYAAWCN